MRPVRILPLLLAIAAIGMAAGCGGDDEEDEATEAATTATETEAGGGGAQTVGMTEFEFDPNDLTVSQGDVITAQNDGATTHNLTIEEEPDAETASTELAATSDVAAGDSADLTVDVDPGDHSIVCTIGNHREQGMIGTIKVE
jgi:plastocyanin